MIFQDDRTTEELAANTYPVIVLMTDRFMSGWGEAQGGPSYAGWACNAENMHRVERWVRDRTDGMRVRLVSGNYRPRGLRTRPGHCHIYKVTTGHPALR